MISWQVQCTRRALRWAAVLCALPLIALSGCLQGEPADESDALTLSFFSSCHRRFDNLTLSGCGATERLSTANEVPEDADCLESFANFAEGGSMSDPVWWLGFWVTDRRTIHLEFAQSPDRSDNLFGSANIESDGITHRMHGYSTGEPGSRLILTTTFEEEISTTHSRFRFYTLTIEPNHSSLQPQAWKLRVVDVEFDERVQAYYLWEWSEGPYWFDPMGLFTFAGKQSIVPRSHHWIGEDFTLRADVRQPFDGGGIIDVPSEPLLPLPQQEGRCTFPPWY